MSSSVVEAAIVAHGTLSACRIEGQDLPGRGALPRLRCCSKRPAQQLRRPPMNPESPVSRILSDCSVAIICLGCSSPNTSLRPTPG